MRYATNHEKSIGKSAILRRPRKIEIYTCLEKNLSSNKLVEVDNTSDSTNPSSKISHIYSASASNINRHNQIKIPKIQIVGIFIENNHFQVRYQSSWL